MAASTVRPSRANRPAAKKPSKSKARSGGAAANPTMPNAPVRTASAFNESRRVPPPVNEPVKSYAPGSPERAALKERLRSMANEKIEIPLVIGGKEIRTGDLVDSVMPHNHRHVLGQWHRATESNIDDAIRAATSAARDWANWAWEDRAAVFLKAAELLATPWRATLNAAPRLGQST